VESLLDDLARKLNMDQLTLREKNAARNGTKAHYGVSHTNIGFEQVLAAVKSHPHWKTPVKEGQAAAWHAVSGATSGANPTRKH
jgi:CO/xanthine dehydrogenase Mo-binding subunit